MARKKNQPLNNMSSPTLPAYPTFRWTLTLGVTPGYNLDAQTPPDLNAIGASYQRIAQAVYASSGVYVSATLAESRALYSRDWGCPEGGELTVTFSGSCNLSFAEPDAYRAALEQVARALKAEFRQETALLELTPCETVYYK